MKKIIISIIATLALVIVPASFAHAQYSGDWYTPSGGSDYTYSSGYSYTQTAAAPCSPTDFTADEYTLNAGQSTVLHWDSTAGCDSARIDPAAYPQDRPPYGSVSTGRIDQTTVYTLTVYDAQGNIGGQRFLTVNIRSGNNGGGTPSSNCRITNFDASDTSIQDGDSSVLSWDTVGCDSAKINQGIGSVNLSGSRRVYPSDTTTYTLSAYDSNGNLVDTDTVKINVDNNNNDSCSIDSFRASDDNIQSGDSVTLTWRTTDASGVDLSPGGSYDADDSVTVHPNYTTTYELTANCKHGSDKHKSITIDVNGNSRSSAPQAVTTVATITSPTTAQLNGIAFPNTNSGSTSAWFQWGPSTSLNFATAAQPIPSNNSQSYYNAPVSGLVPGTQYYYRAVVRNQNGTAYGDIVPFRSIAATPTTTVVRTQVLGTSVTAKSAPSLLELRVDSAYDRMCVGGTIDYTITYRNISSTTLRDAVLQVNHQKEVTFVGSSRGTYDVAERTVTVALGDIAPGESGTVILHGRVNSDAIQGTLTVLTAQVVYTNSATHAQESAIAYSLVTVTNDCPNILGASAFGFGNFLPHTLLAWLLLILVILALIVLGRNLYKKPKPAPTV